MAGQTPCGEQAPGLSQSVLLSIAVARNATFMSNRNGQRRKLTLLLKN